MRIYFSCFVFSLLFYSNHIFAETTFINEVITKLNYIPPISKCNDLINSNFSPIVGRKTKITSALEIDLYCEVSGTIEPSLNFKVKLPLRNWSQRYIQLGCARFCGNIFLRQPEAIESCFPASNDEVVLAANNLGHVSNNILNSEWGRDFKLRADFAHKANHLTSVAVKALIKTFYGQAPKYSYFVGCSSGGREALIEAQRYPKDFDGLVAGASAINFTTQNSFFHSWNVNVNKDANGNAILKSWKIPVLKNAVLTKCDEIDGVKDGVINSPWLCDFDAQTLLCKENESSKQCLSQEEIRVVKELYQGAHDEKGKRLTVHGLVFGSEALWPISIIPSFDQPAIGREISTKVIRDILFEKLLPMDFSIDNFKYTKENFAATTKLHSLYDGTNPHIEKFVARSGKLIMWHGLMDADLSPYNSIAYYHALEKKFGQAKADKFVKLYLLPGTGHCGNGGNPASLELLTAIMNWVEADKAPFMLVGTWKEMPKNDIGNIPPKSKSELKIVRTRPVFPYPISTEYIGTGDVNQASSFKQGKMIPIPEKDLDWLGSKFFK